MGRGLYSAMELEQIDQLIEEDESVRWLIKEASWYEFWDALALIYEWDNQIQKIIMEEEKDGKATNGFILWKWGVQD